MRYGAVIVIPKYLEYYHDPVGVVHEAKRHIKEFADTGITRIVLVEPRRLRSFLKPLESQSVVYLNAERDLFVDLVGYGFNYLAGCCDRVFITSVDQQSVTRETLLELMGSSADVILPMSGGKVVHPLLLGSRLAPWFSLYNGHRGVKGVIESITRTGNGSVKTVNIDQITAVRYMNARTGYHSMIHETDLSQLMRRSG